MSRALLSAFCRTNHFMVGEKNLSGPAEVTPPPPPPNAKIPVKQPPVAPDLLFVAFWDFLAFFAFQGIPCSFECFPFFFGDLGGLEERENPFFFGGFPCLFPIKQGEKKINLAAHPREFSVNLFLAFDIPLTDHLVGKTCHCFRQLTDFFDWILQKIKRNQQTISRLE